MRTPVTLTTARLLLRQWTEADREPFAAMSADPEVMRYFPKTLSREESDAMIERIRAKIAEQSWGLWACERREDGQFMGWVGLWPVPEGLPAHPGVEIGWRLAREFWGNGYATEAGVESLRFGFEEMALERIVSFTTVTNSPSRAVMERLGLTDLEQDFDHPSLAEGHPLQRHVLYGITREAWLRPDRESGTR